MHCIDDSGEYRIALSEDVDDTPEQFAFMIAVKEDIEGCLCNNLLVCTGSMFVASSIECFPENL